MTKQSSEFVRYDLPVLLRMLTPVAFIGLVFMHFHEFILGAIKANVAINSGIIVAASYGVVLIVLRLLGLQSDMRALARFSSEARSGIDMKELIEQPWIKGRAVVHYLEPIAHTEGTLSTQLEQDAIQNELHALSEEYNSKMELPQFLVGFMIAMGLLGTFIGLLETLTGISGMLDGMGHGGNLEEEFSKLVVELRKPLAGMGIAFSASMFGLVTSLMLSIMMVMLRRYTSRVIEKARNVMHRLLTRIKATMPGDGDRGGAYAGNDVVPGMGGSEGFLSQETVVTMVNSVNFLVKRMDIVSKSLEESIAVSKKTNGLLNFGPRMTESQEQLVQEVRLFSQAQAESQKLFQKVISALIQIDQSLLANNTKDVVVAQREGTMILNDMFGNIQSQTRLLGDMTATQREGNEGFALAMRGLQDRIAKLEEVNIGTSRHMFDIKESLAQSISSFALFDVVAENVGKQTMLAEASLSELRGLQRMLMSGVKSAQEGQAAPTAKAGNGPT